MKNPEVSEAWYVRFMVWILGKPRVTVYIWESIDDMQGVTIPTESAAVQEQENDGMRYEYDKRLSTSQVPPAKTLNRMAKDGWEYVQGVLTNPDDHMPDARGHETKGVYTVIYRRPVHEAKPKPKPAPRGLDRVRREIEMLKSDTIISAGSYWQDELEKMLTALLAVAEEAHGVLGLLYSRSEGPESSLKDVQHHAHTFQLGWALKELEKL